MALGETRESLHWWMRRPFFILFCILSLLPGCVLSQTAAPKLDPLGRSDPRSTLTAFLESCHSDNYSLASQYLDLRQLPQRDRVEEGPRLARQLEAVMNSDSRFNVLQLSQAPEGNLSDDTNPSLEHVATISRNGQSFTIDLERVELQPGSPVWLFSPQTISVIPSLTPTSAESAIEARLPRFLVSARPLDTPVWKWVALVIVAIIVVFLFRLSFHLLTLLMTRFAAHFKSSSRWVWVPAVLQPWLVFLSAMGFGLAEQFIDPSALSRLYVGRFILLVVVWSFAWCLINLLDLFMLHLDSLLDPRQRVVSHSLIYLSRKVIKVVIVVATAILVLDNWGYNMTTIIAGLGVGGIAVALAAQSTIANVFGGVSVIGDSPVMVGDYGNFGGVLGTVEDIGMRSTRVRTLNRTMMSIPNASFAGMNLENYALRDKILFNPTLQIKRATPKDKIRQLMKALEDLLKNDKRMEFGPSPVRLSNLTSASFALEIFAYALTADIDEFYKIEADLFLAIDDALSSSGIELA
jgi:MscS family membrane protein